MQFKVAALAGAAVLALIAGQASAADLACLITKNNTNPFFVKMKEGAEAAATAAGLDFQAYAGEKDGDAAPQLAGAVLERPRVDADPDAVVNRRIPHEEVEIVN